MSDLFNKLIAASILAAGFFAALLGFGYKMKQSGRNESEAESNESELNAIKERQDYVTEIQRDNRNISRDELYNGLREHAKKDSD